METNYRLITRRDGQDIRAQVNDEGKIEYCVKKFQHSETPIFLIYVYDNGIPVLWDFDFDDAGAFQNAREELNGNRTFTGGSKDDETLQMIDGILDFYHLEDVFDADDDDE